MNVTAYSCGDTSLGFSCGDCPSASVCSSSAPTQPHKKGSCSVRIGSLKVCKFKFRMLKTDDSCIQWFSYGCYLQARCIEVSLAIVYIVLASLFLGWGLCIKRGSRNPSLKANPFANVTNGGRVQHVRSKKDETIAMQVHTNVQFWLRVVLIYQLVISFL